VTKTRRLSDSSLVRRSQQGDRRAFGALVGRYDWRLRGLAHALLLDPAEMDSALRLAYLRGWRDVVRLRANDDPARWLYRITYNACIDLLRRDATRPGAATHLLASADGRRAALLEGLAALAPADRVAVVLVDREGFAPTAAARILGLSPDVLQVRLAAARAELAARLDAATVASTDDEPAGSPSATGDEPAEQTPTGKGAEPDEPAIVGDATAGNGWGASVSDEPAAAAGGEEARGTARAAPVATDGNGATPVTADGADADGPDDPEPEVGAEVDATVVGDPRGDVQNTPEGDGERSRGGRARRGRRAPKHARRSTGTDPDTPVPGTPP
jgi:RNA polymerase sigma-70 factor (ECF subfamily)